MCVVCLEKEKKKKKNFCNELVQQYVCGVLREREKKKIFCNGTYAAAVRHFLLSILMTTYIYVAFKILGPS
jgi:hypothetical protein